MPQDLPRVHYWKNVAIMAFGVLGGAASLYSTVSALV